MDNAQSKPWVLAWLLLICFMLAGFCCDADAQSVEDPSMQIAELQASIDDLHQRINALQSRSQSSPFNGEIVDSSDASAWPDCDDCPTSAGPSSSHYLVYDDAWVIRPNNSGRTPFELRFNIHNQFRYTGFANSNDLFVDSAGNTIPISARNDFDINRGRFVFSGYAFDPNLEFYTNVDYNTVANDPVLLLLSWVSYRFGDALTIRAGLLKVPGTWEWEQSSRFTLGAERSLATTFFRPSITAGVWAQGTLGESVFYRALVGDGFNTFTLRAAELDVNLAYSALLWWEKGEHFGVGYSDLECHESLSLRVGHGFTYASNDSDPIGEPGPEQTVIRLSDGTRLVEPGAIAPGVTVNEFDISLYTVHLGLKRRGLSFAAEYFFRWLTSLAATGPIPDSSLFDHGFFAQGGAFVIPKRLELYAIGSQVRGEFGSGTQIGGGVNWYVKGERGARFTFDVSRIEDSPADQDRTGLVAGGSGTLFRVQWWHFF